MHQRAVDQFVRAREMEGATPSDVSALRSAFADGGIKAFLRVQIE
jgi:hypothetical protein